VTRIRTAPRSGRPSTSQLNHPPVTGGGPWPSGSCTTDYARGVVARTQASRASSRHRRRLPTYRQVRLVSPDLRCRRGPARSMIRAVPLPTGSRPVRRRHRPRCSRVHRVSRGQLRYRLLRRGPRVNPVYRPRLSRRPPAGHLRPDQQFRVSRAAAPVRRPDRPTRLRCMSARGEASAVRAVAPLRRTAVR